VKIARIIFVSVMLLYAFSSQAASFTIDTNSAAYNTFGNAQGVGVISELAERQAAMFALVGRHNTIVNSGNPIQNGDTVTFKWQDGSSEKAYVTEVRSSVGINPIPGTQSKPPNGGLGYTNGPNGNSYGGSNVIGFTPIYATQTVCVGGYCESILVVTGYEFYYGIGGGPRDQVV
jgi:hypothetical protein